MGKEKKEKERPDEVETPPDLVLRDPPLKGSVVNTHAPLEAA